MKTHATQHHDLKIPSWANAHEDGYRLTLADISTYRGELMGLAMLMIMLFHVPLSSHNPFFGLHRMGNIGVDIFFFLSGVGLWFSWTKNPNYKHFFKRRYLRVYPAWLLMASLYYIPRFKGGDTMAWVDLFGDITINWGFWLHDELTFWYIPAAMMLYLFAPAYMNLIKRDTTYRWLPVVMVVWCVAVQWVAPIHNAVGHLEIFWSRVPIFFIGLGMGERVQQKHSAPLSSVWLLLAVVLIGMGTSIYMEQNLHGKFPLFIERMVYIPVTVCGIWLLGTTLRHIGRGARRALTFIGSISLEIYLIHAHFVLRHLPADWSYWITFLACLACTLPLAWAVWLTTSRLTEKIFKTTKK